MFVLLAVDHPVVLPVVQHMDARKTLYILLELGKAVVPHLEIPELVADAVSENAQENAVFPAVLDLLEDELLQPLLPAPVLKLGHRDLRAGLDKLQLGEGLQETGKQAVPIAAHVKIRVQFDKAAPHLAQTGLPAVVSHSLL